MKNVIVFVSKHLPRPVRRFIGKRVVLPIMFWIGRFLVISVVMSEGSQENSDQLFRDAWNISGKYIEIIEPIMKLRRWSGVSGDEVDAQDLQVLKALRDTIHRSQSLSVKEKARIYDHLASDIYKAWRIKA